MELARLQKKAEKYGISLSRQLLEQLDLYVRLLLEWNGRINLTSIQNPDEIENKHIIDSLLLASQAELTEGLTDVGTGAGFPGIVCKLYKPQIMLTLMEPTQKRARFLELVDAELGLKSRIICARAEEVARREERQRHAFVTARAVAALPQLCEYCLPLVQRGGLFVAMKGEANAELEDSRTAIALLGGEYQETRMFQLPDGSRRSLIFIRKAKDTPVRYPRQGAKIKRAPLSTNVPRGT